MTCGYAGSAGMKRSQKGQSVQRYLTGHAGIPFLRFDGRDNSITAPSPYSIKLVTDAAWWRFSEHVRATSNMTGIPFVIRYDGLIDGVDHAIVGCNLHTFTQLLAAYETNMRRGEQ